MLCKWNGTQFLARRTWSIRAEEWFKSRESVTEEQDHAYNATQCWQLRYGWNWTNNHARAHLQTFTRLSVFPQCILRALLQWYSIITRHLLHHHPSYYNTCHLFNIRALHLMGNYIMCLGVIRYVVNVSILSMQVRNVRSIYMCYMEPVWRKKNGICLKRIICSGNVLAVFPLRTGDHDRIGPLIHYHVISQ